MVLLVTFALAACRNEDARDRDTAHSMRTTAPAPQATAAPGRTQIEPGFRLIGEDAAPTAHLSLAEALERRDRVRGSRDVGWTLRAFDDRELVFIEFKCRPLPPVARPVLRSSCGEGADIQRRVTVTRTPEALDELGVRDEIVMREAGVCGIRVGTRVAELRERFGVPTSTSYPQAVGCLNEQYGDSSDGLVVESCQGEVISVHATRCPP